MTDSPNHLWSDDTLAIDAPDDQLYTPKEYLDVLRLAATQEGYVLLDTIVSADDDERVTVERVTGDNVGDEILHKMKRAALLVERRGPDKDPYLVASSVGQAVHQHVSEGVEMLVRADPAGGEV